MLFSKRFNSSGGICKFCAASCIHDMFIRIAYFDGLIICVHMPQSSVFHIFFVKQKLIDGFESLKVLFALKSNY